MLLPHRPHSACPRRACAHTASPFGLLPRRLPFTEMHTTPRRGERRECPGERKADRERLRLVSDRFSMNQKTTLISHGQKNYFYFLFASFPAREGFTCLWLHFIYNGVIWGKKKQVASYPNSSAHQQLVDRNGFKNSHDICANARRFRRALQREFRGETVAFNEGTLTEIKTCLSFEGRPVNKDPNVLSSCHRLHSPFCRV